MPIPSILIILLVNMAYMIAENMPGNIITTKEVLETYLGNSVIILV